MKYSGSSGVSPLVANYVSFPFGFPRLHARLSVGASFFSLSFMSGLVQRLAISASMWVSFAVIRNNGVQGFGPAPLCSFALISHDMVWVDFSEAVAIESI